MTSSTVQLMVSASNPATAPARADRPAGSGLVAGGPGVAGEVRRGLGAAADLELREDRRDVVLHGLLAELEPEADLAVGQALRDQREDAFLLRRQPGQALVPEQALALSQAVPHGRGDRRVEQALAVAHLPDGADQVGAVDLLEDVAAGPGHDGREQRLVV